MSPLKLVLIFLIFALGKTLNGQTDTSFYYSDHTLVENNFRDYAKYFELNDGKNRTGEIKQFDLDGNLYGIANYVDNKLEGLYTKFYNNGNIKETLQLLKGIAIRYRKRRFRNGRISTIELMSLYDSIPNQLVSAWDSTGNTIIINGEGFFIGNSFNEKGLTLEGRYSDGYKVEEWKGYRNDKLVFKEFYKNGILFHGVSYDSLGTIYPYSETFKQASYSSGIDGWLDYLSKNLKYPQRAQKNNVEGFVYLSFQVSESSEVLNAKIIKGIGYGCNEEALRVINDSGIWTPAKLRGIPIKSNLTLRIGFVLR